MAAEASGVSGGMVRAGMHGLQTLYRGGCPHGVTAVSIFGTVESWSNRGHRVARERVSFEMPQERSDFTLHVCIQTSEQAG